MRIASLDDLRNGALAGARELKLVGDLSEFPDEIFGLAATLEVLDVSGNPLTRLPDDMGRLTKLQALFCSGARFERLPPSLGDCTALSQVGFRGTGMVEVPAEALPPALRWLTLTDNRIETLPDALGERPALQKLMLAGNRLSALPQTLQGARQLELLRLSANRFEALPDGLTDLPRLAWLAWAGNPLDRETDAPPSKAASWTQLQVGALLGHGASGQVFSALWRSGEHDASPPEPVALKLFKGAMTSDGLPEREMAACLAAGAHGHLTGALARLTDHPQGTQGLLMPRLPAHWRVLAGPPSRESCSRDVYDPTRRLDLGVALRIARSVGGAAAHLHGRGLSDFGAASFLPDRRADAYRRLEVRAFGLLLGELLDLCDEDAQSLAPWRKLQADCTQPNPGARPLLGDALAVVEAWGDRGSYIDLKV